MKRYDLYFQRNGKVYVVNVRLNDIEKLILQSITALAKALPLQCNAQWADSCQFCANVQAITSK